MKNKRAMKTVLGSLLAAAVLVMAGDDAIAASRASRAYMIKAAFLYDMSKSTNWPRSAGRELDFCISGQDPFGDAAALIDGKPVNGRVLRVHTGVGANGVTGCDILFVGGSDPAEVNDLLATIGGTSVLTVSEMPDFLERGGMVRLKDVDNRLQFDVDLLAIRRAGLVLRTDALELADSVSAITAGTIQP
ncbi:MAG: YfiR family protein [Dongiaceae bacterium]